MSAVCNGIEVQDVLYQSRNPTRRYLHRRRKTWVLRQIEAWAPRTAGRVALEVGPGSGVYLPSLSRRFVSVVASDVMFAFLDRARLLSAQYDNLSIKQDDIARTSHQAGSMDLVLCTEVVEHIPQVERVIPSLAGLLAPDGVLILTTPQAWSTVEVCARLLRCPGVPWLLRRVYGEPVDNLHHVSLHTAAQLQRRIADAGLSVVASDQFSFYVPGLAEAGGRRAARLARGAESFVGRYLPGLLWTQAYVLRRRA